MAQLKDLIVNGNSRLIGTAYVPTQAAGTDDESAASTAFVKTAIDNAINNAKQSKTATTNGTVYPDGGKILSSVVVNVPASAVTSGNRSCSSAEGDQSGIDVTSYKTVSISGVGSGYVGSGIARRDSSSLSASADVVSVPAGYYASAASKSVGTTSRSNAGGEVSLWNAYGSTSADGNISLTAQSSKPSGYYIVSYGNGTVYGAGRGSISTGSGYISSGTSTSNWSDTSSYTSGTASQYYSIPTGGCSVSGGGLSQSGNSGGGLSGGGLSAGSGEVSLSAGSGSTYAEGNISLTAQSSKPSGYYIISYGSGTVSGQGRGSVSRATINRAAFSNTVTRAAVTDTHTAGYIPAQSATTVISAGSSTVSLAADSIAATSGTSNWSSSSSKSSNQAYQYYSIPTGSCTVAGGGLENWANYSGTPSIGISSGGDTNMSNIELGGSKPYYFRVNANSGALSGNTRAHRYAVTDAHTAGYIPAKDATEVISATDVYSSVSIGENSTYNYVRLSQASFYVSGSSVICNSSGYFPYGSTAGTVPTQSKTTYSPGTVYPDSGYYLSSVNVSISSYTDLS